MHFLHIPKTGGTAIIAALAPHALAYGIVLHDHRVTLRDIAVGERVFFAVRAPLSHFVSGFNSRLRHGRLRDEVPWTAGEAAAFGRFPTPTALGRAVGPQSSHSRGGGAGHGCHRLRRGETGALARRASRARRAARAAGSRARRRAVVS